MPTLDLAPYESLQNDVLTERIQRVRREMGPRLLILGHHYQQDAVIALADLRGDSYKLAELAAKHEAVPGHRLLRRPLHGRNGRHSGQSARAACRSAAGGACR